MRVSTCQNYIANVYKYGIEILSISRYAIGNEFNCFCWVTNFEKSEQDPVKYLEWAPPIDDESYRMYFLGLI